jgi:hypothetical protein
MAKRKESQHGRQRRKKGQGQEPKAEEKQTETRGTEETRQAAEEQAVSGHYSLSLNPLTSAAH